ncbi:unnamed protein product, partial [Mesorhabditis spiculigera]
MEIIFASDADILRHIDIDIDMWIQRRPSLFDPDKDFRLLEQIFRHGVDFINYQSENMIKKEPFPLTNRTWVDRIEHRKVVAQLYWCDGDTNFETAENLKTHCSESFQHITNFIEHNRFKKRKSYKYAVLFDFASGGVPGEVAASILLAQLAKYFTVSMWISIKQFVIRVSDHREMDIFRRLLRLEKLSADLDADGFTLGMAQLAEFDHMYAVHSPVVKQYFRSRPRERSASMLRRVMHGITAGLVSENPPPSNSSRKKSGRQRRMSVPELPENKVIQPALSYKRKPELERNNSVKQLLHRVGAASPLLSKRFLTRRRDKSESPRSVVPLQNSIESTVDCAVSILPNELENSNPGGPPYYNSLEDGRKLSVRMARPHTPIDGR